MAKGIMNSETWIWELSWEKINMIGDNWIKQNIIDEIFMLYQSMNMI
jgi:hypothetical protein